MNAKKVILVFGLPGSGKTTFSEQLNRIIPDSEHINADVVRTKYNDWDFSEEGRRRQALRMRSLANESTADVVILDFVCPLREYREIVNADIMFFIDKIKFGRFEDTNKIFEYPTTENIIRIK